MADRYWVGGDGTWNSSNTTNWSATDGGSGGASVPVSSDRVFFTENSKPTAGNYTVTVSGNVPCGELRFQGTSKFTILNSTGLNSVDVYGTVVNTGSTVGALQTSSVNVIKLYSNCTLSGNNHAYNYTVMSGVTVNMNITSSSVIGAMFVSNASTMIIGENCNVIGLGVNGTVTTSIPIVRVGRTGNQTACLYIKGDIGGHLNLESFYAGAKFFLEPYTNATYTFATTGGSTSYCAKLYLRPASSSAVFTFAGNASISGIERDTGVSACTLQFSPTSNITFSTFGFEGSLGNVCHIQSSVSGTRAPISYSGVGTVSTNYVEVKDMQPVQDDTCISYNSTNAGNNYKWYFDTFTKPTSNLFFGCDI